MDKLNLHSGGKSNEDRRDLDYYPSPPEVTRALMDFICIPEGSLIREPACGEGYMSRVIEGYGHNVIGTDIQFGDNYFDTTLEQKVDAIITNPPFKHAEDFIKKAIGEADIVAMVLKSQYWHAKKRLKLFREHKPTYILPLTWRPDFLFNEPGKGGNSTMEVLWTVWIKGQEDCKYYPLPKPTINNQNKLFK